MIDNVTKLSNNDITSLINDIILHKNDNVCKVLTNHNEIGENYTSFMKNDTTVSSNDIIYLLMFVKNDIIMSNNNIIYRINDISCLIIL